MFSAFGCGLAGAGADGRDGGDAGGADARFKVLAGAVLRRPSKCARPRADPKSIIISPRRLTTLNPTAVVQPAV